MPKREVYKLIDTHIHRIAKITGDIVREKEEYLERMKGMISELTEARKEMYDLVSSLDAIPTKEDEHEGETS